MHSDYYIGCVFIFNYDDDLLGYMRAYHIKFIV